MVKCRGSPTVLPESAQQISQRLAPDALVLDVGGAANPFSRADWVIDLQPYEARGQLGAGTAPGLERFSARTWVQQDICDREAWPFSDRQFDFAVCAHTLEDVRDPVWVAHELQRVARAGYIEVPTVQEELTYGIQGPWVGWGHHHWLVLVQPGKLAFVFKHHVVNRAGSHLPAGAVADLSPAQRVQTFWWTDRFEAGERFMLTAEELDGFLAAMARPAGGQAPSGRDRLRMWERLRARRY